ncbi:hypothetical protein J6P11_06800 [bacterium]|nr:hypothetical protein [bacterium]
MADEEIGHISNVTIQYNSIYLTNNTSGKQFIVELFKALSNTSTNAQIVAKLGTILNQIITVTGYNNTTAADALNNPTELTSSIKNVITTELTNSKQTFNFDDQFSSIADIVNNLIITFPGSISLTNDINAQIPNVIITFNGIELSNTQNTNTFIIEGFEESSAQIIGTTGSPTSRNQQIADLLDSLLNPLIQIN